MSKSEWSLKTIFDELHKEVESNLERSRKTLAHSTTKGDATENIWIDLLQNYLPKRYSVTKAHAVDSKGCFSDQIDVLIFDRQYCPFIFNYKGQSIVPAESVYAAFEARQTVSKENIDYAKKKITSVRKLHRTSMPIPHAGGKYASKEPHQILGGLLTLDSEWKAPFTDILQKNLQTNDENERLHLGCIASYGMYSQKTENEYVFAIEKPATTFLFELISRLQQCGTVPMIDMGAYVKWL